MKQVFSSGGGTQSCAISALIIQGRLPKPDVAVIVDTTREKSSTWAYAEAYTMPALASVGVELHRICRDDFAKEDVWDQQGKHLLIPAFTSQGENIGKLSGYCSDKWKRRVRDRWLRSRGIKSACIWIGYSLDEPRRWTRMMASDEYAAGKLRLPLIHDVPMRREQSIALCESMGWPTPPRSACSMCPNQSDDEWRDLKKNYPAEFQRAVELEREIQKRDPFAWLHKSCQPLDTVVFSDPEPDSRPCESGGCFI